MVPIVAPPVRPLVAPLQPGDPEVADLHRAVGGEHQVVGLDVAVNDPGGVRGGQALGRLRPEPEDVLDREPAGVPVQQALQVRAVQVFQHQIGQPAVLADVVDRGDVAVYQPRGRTSLPLEPR